MTWSAMRRCRRAPPAAARCQPATILAGPATPIGQEAPHLAQQRHQPARVGAWVEEEEGEVVEGMGGW